VYDKSRTDKCGSRCKESSPSEPTEGQDIKINDPISGQDAVVADKQSSLSWLHVNNTYQSWDMSGDSQKNYQKVT